MDQRTSVRERTIERVYRERGQRMWQAILAFSGDAYIADDAVAEAFAQALRRQDEIRDIERWIWRASYRIAAGAMKLRAQTVVQPLPDHAYDMEEPARDLIRALAQLSHNQRASVVLHDAIGHPAKEVAAILGSSPAAVRVHVMRGRRRLRELLKEKETDA